VADWLICNASDLIGVDAGVQHRKGGISVREVTRVLDHSPSNTLALPTPARSFLVTCLGAYEDSGLGTGGFVCVHEGRPTVIDKIDSTGLIGVDGSFYRYVRSLKSIVGYREDGIAYWLKVPEARDVHDILLQNGSFVCASTGTNEILWFDFLGRITRRWKADGERDAWHLNCLCTANGRLFASAFGRFALHRGWLGNCTGSGFIFEVDTGEEVVRGLNGPHNPRWIGDEWVVCDSHVNALACQRTDGELSRVTLDGLTRGLEHDSDFLYVGESANRKAPIPTEYSAIAILDRRTLEVTARIQIPFPEIYEIVVVPDGLAAAMSSEPESFQLDRYEERYAHLERQVEIGWSEAEQLKRRIEPLLGIEYCRGRLVEFKRKIFG
jgi:hypothetical protein